MVLTFFSLQALPGLFPVKFRFYNPVAEVPPYILLLHISFPLLMETFAPRDFFKVRAVRSLPSHVTLLPQTLLRAWLEAVGTALDIRDRVLPQDQIDEGARAQDQAEEPAQEEVQEQASANERSSEADILQEDQSDGREKRSILKESLVMLHLACLSIALVGGFSVIVPLLVGRQILAVLGVNECNDMYAYSIGFSSTGELSSSCSLPLSYPPPPLALLPIFLFVSLFVSLSLILFLTLLLVHCSK